MGIKLSVSETTDSIERAYIEHWRKMTGQQRLQRTFSLYNSIVGMVRYRLQREHPEWDERAIRMHTAAVLYQSDEATMDLLRKAGLP